MSAFFFWELTLLPGNMPFAFWLTVIPMNFVAVLMETTAEFVDGFATFGLPEATVLSFPMASIFEPALVSLEWAWTYEVLVFSILFRFLAASESLSLFDGPPPRTKPPPCLLPPYKGVSYSPHLILVTSFPDPPDAELD
jgi:hypothetical protein